MRKIFRGFFKESKFTQILSNSKGLTLVELLAVIVILGIVAGIATPTVQEVIGKAKQEACLVNAAQLEKMYETQLIIDGAEHSEELFAQFMIESSGISFEDGEYQYIDGKVQCSAYSDEDGEVDPDDQEEEDEVPYL